MNIHVNNEGIRKEIEELLVCTLSKLITEGMNKGHWGNIRGTSDSLIAMKKCLDDPYPTLRKYAYKHIINNSIEEDNGSGTHWEEEVWDTSIALIALSCEYGSYNKKIITGWQWLKSKYNKINNNWHDEPWETSWALIALHDIIKHREALNDGIPWTESLRWLSQLVGKPPRCLLINWHYSALFLLIVNRYLEEVYLKGDEYLSLINELRTGQNNIIIESLKYINDNKDVDSLWTHELWSNSLVLWAICETDFEESEEYHLENPDDVTRIYNWFKKEITDENSQQTEDYAFACIALFELLNLLNINENKKYQNLCHEMKNIYSINKDHMKMIDSLIDKLKIVERENLKINLTKKLSNEIKGRDYIPKPEFISKQYHSGYFTINILENIGFIGIVIVASVLLTFLTYGIQPYVPDRLGNILTKIPIGIGTFLTILKLLDLSPKDLLKYRKKSPK